MIKLIDRYILRFHVAPFLFGFFTVIFLFLMQFLMRYLDQLVGKGLSAWVVTQLIAYNLSWMVVLAVPMGVLFSTLMAFGGLSANHEITTIKAGGGSLLRMMFPVILVGIAMTYGLYRFNDEVLPESNHRAKIMLNDIKRKKPTFALEPGQFSTQLEGYTILARQVDSSGLLRGVTIYDQTRISTKNIISADSGTVMPTRDFNWMILTLYNGEIHQSPVNAFKNYRVVDFGEYKIALKAEGFSLEKTASDMMPKSDRELTIKEMRALVDESMKNSSTADSRVQKEIEHHYSYLMGSARGLLSSSNGESGFARPGMLSNHADTGAAATIDRLDRRVSMLKSAVSTDIAQIDEFRQRADSFQVEIQKKYSIPFACFLFIFVGCPLGIKTRGGNFGVSAGISLGFYILYWACLIGGEKLADRGLMSPYISMWLGNIIIGLLGLILTLKVNNESLTLSRTKYFLRITNFAAKLFGRK